MNIIKNLFNYNTPQGILNIVLTIVAILFLLHLFNKNILEHMSETTLTDTELVHNKVKEIYDMDVASIRNLSDVASKLTNPEDGSVTIPGNLVVDGTVTATGDATFNNASIGGADWAKFGHKDWGKYNIQAAANGRTMINTSSTISFKKDDAGSNITFMPEKGLGTFTSVNINNPSEMGITHFNHDGKGNNYIRGTGYLNLGQSNSKMYISSSMIK